MSHRATYVEEPRATSESLLSAAEGYLFVDAAMYAAEDVACSAISRCKNMWPPLPVMSLEDEICSFNTDRRGEDLTSPLIRSFTDLIYCSDW